MTTGTKETDYKELLRSYVELENKLKLVEGKLSIKNYIHLYKCMYIQKTRMNVCIHKHKCMYTKL